MLYRRGLKSFITIRRIFDGHGGWQRITFYSGLKVTRTSLISFLAFLRVCWIFSSNALVSVTVTDPGTVAVRSTNMRDPARRARTEDMESIG